MGCALSWPRCVKERGEVWALWRARLGVMPPWPLLWGQAMGNCLPLPPPASGYQRLLCPLVAGAASASCSAVSFQDPLAKDLLYFLLPFSLLLPSFLPLS